MNNFTVNVQHDPARNGRFDIVVFTGQGNDAFAVGSLASNQTVTAWGGDGDDALWIGDAQGHAFSDAIDGPVTVTACSTSEGSNCEQFAKCNVRDPLWRVRERILSALGECTIAELAADVPASPASVEHAMVLHTQI